MNVGKLKKILAHIPNSAQIEVAVFAPQISEDEPKRGECLPLQAILGSPHPDLAARLCTLIVGID